MKKILFFFASIVIAEAKVTKDKVLKAKPKLGEKSGKNSFSPPKPIESESKVEFPHVKSGAYNTYFSVGLGGGGVYQTGNFESRKEQTNAFTRNNNPYSAQGFLGIARVGIHTVQGLLYLGSDIYGILNPINKRIYYNADTINDNDSVNVKTSWGGGISLNFGMSFNQIKPYLILGVEYNPKTLTYVANAPSATDRVNISYRQKNVAFPIGIGLSGDLNSKTSLSFEIVRKSGRDFDVTLPSNGAGSLDDQRLRVTTPQWTAIVAISYKFDLG